MFQDVSVKGQWANHGKNIFFFLNKFSTICKEVVMLCLWCHISGHWRLV